MNVSVDVRAIIADLDDADLDTLHRDASAGIDVRLEAAGEIGARKARARDARHAAFHGRPIRRVKVGARRGYRGDIVCHDCYFGKEWDGR